VKATSDVNRVSDAHREVGVPPRNLFRLLTCGSVDDGKSTLVGRLLLDSSQVFKDQLRALQRDSKIYGTVDNDIDASLLLDGLEAEREQAITIDVAYRHFATPRRRFIVADAPGHIQYTRNMITGASTSDLAVLLVDAAKGLLEQTRRHSFICSLLGIRHFVLVVNKMDLVGFRQEAFSNITDAAREFAKELKIDSLVAIPVSALFGDNIVHRSARMPWYDGPPLLEYLETVANLVIGKDLVHYGRKRAAPTSSDRVAAAQLAGAAAE